MSTPNSQKATISRYKEQVKQLREQLRIAEQKIQTLEYGEDSEEVFRLREEVIRKDEDNLQLQASLEARTLELDNMHARVAELDKAVNQSNERQHKHLQLIDQLHLKLSRSEGTNVSLTDQLETLKLDYSDTKRQLRSAEEKVETLGRMRRELEDQLEQALQGADVARQLAHDLRSKDREVLTLRDELARCRQELARALDAHQALSSRHELEVASLQERLREEIHSLQEKLRERPAENVAAQLQEAEERWRAHAEDHRLRFEAERDQLARERDEARRAADHQAAALRARDQHVDRLTAEVARLQEEFAAHREELRVQMEESLVDNRAIDELHTQIELQRELLENIQTNLRETAVERDELRREVELLRKTSEFSRDIEVKCEDLQQQLRTVLEREKQLLTNFETERSSLHQMLETSEFRLTQKEEILDTKQLEEDASHSVTRNICESFEIEKTRLEEKIVKLQLELVDTRTSANIADSEYQKIKDEKEALENHIEFLNSVIVDMQQKNDELVSRVQIVETRGIFDGQVNFYNDGRQTLVFPLFSYEDTAAQS